MAEKNIQNFEHSELEADIQRLSREIIEKKKNPEYKDFSDKELIKETIRPIINSTAKQAENGNKMPFSSAEKTFLPDYAIGLSDEEKLKVEKLIEAVFHNGLKAITESQKNEASVIDAFHDALTDKLFEELKQKKIL